MSIDLALLIIIYNQYLIGISKRSEINDRRDPQATQRAGDPRSTRRCEPDPDPAPTCSIRRAALEPRPRAITARPDGERVGLMTRAAASHSHQARLTGLRRSPQSLPSNPCFAGRI